MKVVHKPWGKEVWLELNEKYCYKRIYINEGTRTSFQYHLKKLETNYIISGKAEIWLENEDGIVEKKIMEAGDFFTVIPPRKHRVIAITDLILQEVSTPEVDDVVRIQDDSNRPDGKIEKEHLKPAMCILTAGMGNRLGKYTEYINKSLIPIDNMAAISHIIKKTPPEYEIVVAIGYMGDQVRDYCLAAHPERSFKFVEVESFNPDRTGPATSLYACKHLLQRPFYFCACDVYFEGDLEPCSSDWLGLSRTVLSELYATVDLGSDGKVKKIKDKSEKGYEYAWTGLMSVFSHEKFWRSFRPSQKEIPDVLKDSNVSFGSRFYTWYDIGTLDNYIKARKIIERDSDTFVIPKINGEFFYRVENKAIKINQSKQSVKNIGSRFKVLSKTLPLPDLKYCKNNVLSYDWEPGETLYSVDNFEVFKMFLNFCDERMWKNICTDESFNTKRAVRDFYIKKTIDRVESFLNTRDRNMYSKSVSINGFTIRSIESQIKTIEDKINNHSGLFVEDYHGDFHFENILFNKDSKDFSLIDWRPDFGSQARFGDVYYDLAKMYAGLTVDFNKIKISENTRIKFLEDSLILNTEMSEDIIKFKRYYESWLVNNKFDLDTVKIMAGAILIGISTLHEKSQGDFIYFNGRKLIDESR